METGGPMEVNRRKFFARVSAWIAGLIGAAMAIPIVGYIVSPAYRRHPKDWLDLGSPGNLKPGEPLELSSTVTVIDGWMKTSEVKSVWAVRQKDQSVTVYSPLCTHLGCGYRWDRSEETFKCPCHNSVFDIEGKVLKGPAPRPLDTLPVKVEGGKLLVLFKEFKAGTPKKEEL